MQATGRIGGSSLWDRAMRTPLQNAGISGLKSVGTIVPWIS